mgnify:CR=1 FL=1
MAIINYSPVPASHLQGFLANSEIIHGVEPIIEANLKGLVAKSTRGHSLNGDPENEAQILGEDLWNATGRNDPLFNAIFSWQPPLA